MKSKTLTEKLLDVYYETYADVSESKKVWEEKEKDLNVLKGVLKTHGISIPLEPEQIATTGSNDWAAMILSTLNDVHKPIKRGELVKMIVEAYKLDEELVQWNINTKITSLAREKKISKAQRLADKRGGYYIPQIWVENGKLKPQYKRFIEGFSLIKVN
jgi:hypothetical protein